MACLAARDGRLDATAPELAAVLLVVIATVGEQLVGALAGAADPALDGAEPIDSSWVT